MADMEVYIYPWKTSDDYLVDDAENALSNAFSVLDNNTTIGSFNTTARHDHPSLNGPYSTITGFYNDFDSWRESNHTEVGCHLGITDNVNASGRGEAGNSSTTNAFVDDRTSVGAGDGGAVFDAIVIQEVFHPFINSHLPIVDDMTSYGGEHDLGKVYSSNDVSPMAARYPDSYDRGTCWSNYSKSGFSHSPTTCTQDALEATFEDST